MNPKNQNNGQNKKQQDSKPQSPKQNDKQQNQNNSNPKSSSNPQKNNQKSSNEKNKNDNKKKNDEKSKSDDKKQKKTNDEKSKTKNEVSVKQAKEVTTKSDQKKKQKNPKLEVVKPNLKKTDKKTLSPIQEFELTVEKIKKLENSGYKQLQSIGEGSYGKVFTSKSAKHRKKVAVKAVDLKRLSELFKKKFLVVEIELMTKMAEHKNVIKFYEVIEATDDHLLYISMEFCPNGDLYDYIIKRHYIPEREACLWFRELMSGLQHIHKNGFAHRDIKCENLLFDDKYNIKIVDFGFCCKIRYENNIIKKEDKIVNISKDEIPSQTYCGSVIYASPELLRGMPYLPTKTDIWSSGVVLYVMLFGCYPNDGTELERFIQKSEHCIEAPESPEVSKECKELIKNILVDEEKRYSMKDIKDSKWFKMKWEPIDNTISTKEYFENLNIQRAETLEFEYNPEEKTHSFKSDDNSELKFLGSPKQNTQNN